jgi:hypothetical protein
MQAQVKILGGGTVFCQKDRCEEPATRLFRTDHGPVTAYCESHARAEADRIGIKLPMDDTDVLHADW